jgi:hypothetical protein
MALFWETTSTPKPATTTRPISPFAVALLLKLQAESGK